MDVAERGLAPLGATGGVTGARCARTRSRFAPLGAAGGVTTTPPPALRARGQCGLGRRAARGLALAPLRSVPPGASQAPPALRAQGRCGLGRCYALGGDSRWRARLADWVLFYAHEQGGLALARSAGRLGTSLRSARHRWRVATPCAARRRVEQFDAKGELSKARSRCVPLGTLTRRNAPAARGVLG